MNDHYLSNGDPYIWSLLCEYIDHGLAAHGAIGELIGRALSISAMDRAIKRLPVASHRFPPRTRIPDAHDGYGLLQGTSYGRSMG